MSSLKPLIKKAIAEGVIAQTSKRSFKRDAAGAGIIAVSGLVALGGLGFLTASAYVTLLGTFDPGFSALIIGVSLVVLALLAIWTGLQVMGQKRVENEQQTRREVESLIDVLTDEVAGDISQPVQENPKTSLAAAALAGFIAGDKLH